MGWKKWSGFPLGRYCPKHSNASDFFRPLYRQIVNRWGETSSAVNAKSAKLTVENSGAAWSQQVVESQEAFSSTNKKRKLPHFAEFRLCITVITHK